MKKISFKSTWQVIKKAFSGFLADKVTKLSASLAYCTVFSLAPLLIVVIYLCSLFFGREAIEGSIYGQIASFVGHDTALQLQEIIRNASLQGKNSFAAIIGFIALAIGATAVFAEIQDSINIIWGLKAKPKKGLLKMVLNRLLSFSLVVTLGFLLLVSLFINTIMDGLGQHLRNAFPELAIVVIYIINIVLTFVVITLLFGIIFKVLPDARIKWKDVLAGALTTAFLFMLGKFAISFYISKSHIGNTYGTAGSLVILLVWVYYSSIILYFGAEFTKAWAVQYGDTILPNPYAVTIQQVEVETGKKTIRENETGESSNDHNRPRDYD